MNMEARNLREMCQKLSQLPTDQDLSVRGNPMDLENSLRQVQTDRHHLSHGRPL
jgi:hypothetical protein